MLQQVTLERELFYTGFLVCDSWLKVFVILSYCQKFSTWLSSFFSQGKRGNVALIREPQSSLCI